MCITLGLVQPYRAAHVSNEWDQPACALIVSLMSHASWIMLMYRKSVNFGEIAYFNLLA
jgi:hypothetical protein